MEFIGETISVQTQGQAKRPASFSWRDRTYRIDRILVSWRDYAMPAHLRRPKWTMRRHRNYYHVQTDSGERFEIYLDRGAKRLEWVLLKRLEPVPPRRKPHSSDPDPKDGNPARPGMQEGMLHRPPGPRGNADGLS